MAGLEETEIREQLSDLFEVLTEPQQTRLLECMTYRHYRKDELIYHEGETPRQLFCLLSGKVKIYKDGIGRSQIVRVISPGEYFGYRAAIAHEAFITEAAAFEHSFIVKFPLALIWEYMQENARLGCFFVQKLAMALGKSDERLVSLTQKHVRARLADSLLYLKEFYGLEDDGQTLAAHLSRYDLANLSNMTTNNAIRTLRGFVAEGIIDARRRDLRIINEQELRHISAIG